jgi:hypothetical protein
VDCTIGQLSFERQSLVNLSSLASTTNIPFGMLRVVTGMTTIGTACMTGLMPELEGSEEEGGAIWLKRAFDQLYPYKNNLPSAVHTYIYGHGKLYRRVLLVD